MQIDKTENIFETNPYNPSLYFKPIVCKKNNYTFVY